MTGVVLIDKPQDFTSFDVVAVMRRTLCEKRLGHTGTLDPMATGVLPIMVGRATRLCDLLPVSDKQYIAKIRLGIETDTYDITGTVLNERPVEIDVEQLKAFNSRFSGKIKQMAPMYSAVSVGGKRLYDLARQGIEVEREARDIEIYSNEFLSFDRSSNEFEIKVSCSKGTYIRSIAHDLGALAGCGAALSSLRRTSACGFDISECIPLSRAREMTPEQLIMPLDSALLPYSRVNITAAQSTRFQNGGALSCERLEMPQSVTKYLRVYSPDGSLIALGEFSDSDNEIKVKCLLI